MTIVSRKQREFQRREEDILDAALVLLSQPNWESVTVEQIAQAAEVGKGTVYTHFSGKEELYFRLMHRFHRGLLHRLRNQEPDADVLRYIRHSFELVFEFHLQNSEYRYVVDYCKRVDFRERADASWHSTFKEIDEATREWSRPLVESAIKQGLIEKRSFEELDTGIHACIDGAIAMLWASKDWFEYGDDDQIIRSATSFMMAGLIGKA